jgi:hypothetical protein
MLAKLDATSLVATGDVTRICVMIEENLNNSHTSLLRRTRAIQGCPVTVVPGIHLLFHSRGESEQLPDLHYTDVQPPRSEAARI